MRFDLEEFRLRPREVASALIEELTLDAETDSKYQL